MLGWSFGIVAMGITLLRIVDPNNKSDTLPDYVTGYAISGTIETVLIVVAPILVSLGYGLPLAIVLVILSFLCWFITYKVFGIQNMAGHHPRPGEAHIHAKNH